MTPSGRERRLQIVYESRLSLGGDNPATLAVGGYVRVEPDPRRGRGYRHGGRGQDPHELLRGGRVHPSGPADQEQPFKPSPGARSSTWTAPVPPALSGAGQNASTPSQRRSHRSTIAFSTGRRLAELRPFPWMYAHAAKTAPACVVDELEHRALRLGGVHAVQIELILDRVVTPAEPAGSPGAGGRGE